MGSKKHIDAFDIIDYEHSICNKNSENIDQISLNSQSVPFHSLVKIIDYQSMKKLLSY